MTHETTPDDIAGMAAAVGILTQTGGATSHAAVVARAMDKPCVVGATELDLALLKSQAVKGALHRITIDGATGRVWIELEVPVVNGAETPPVRRITDWCVRAVGRGAQHAGRVTRSGSAGDPRRGMVGLGEDDGGGARRPGSGRRRGPRSSSTSARRARSGRAPTRFWSGRSTSRPRTRSGSCWSGAAAAGRGARACHPDRRGRRDGARSLDCATYSDRGPRSGGAEPTTSCSLSSAK